MPRPSARTKYFLSITILKLSRTKLCPWLKSPFFDLKNHSKWILPAENEFSTYTANVYIHCTVTDTVLEMYFEFECIHQRCKNRISNFISIHQYRCISAKEITSGKKKVFLALSKIVASNKWFSILIIQCRMYPLLRKWVLFSCYYEKLQ